MSPHPPSLVDNALAIVHIEMVAEFLRFRFPFDSPSLSPSTQLAGSVPVYSSSYSLGQAGNQINQILPLFLFLCLRVLIRPRHLTSHLLQVSYACYDPLSCIFELSGLWPQLPFLLSFRTRTHICRLTVYTILTLPEQERQTRGQGSMCIARCMGTAAACAVRWKWPFRHNHKFASSFSDFLLSPTRHASPSPSPKSTTSPSPQHETILSFPPNSCLVALPFTCTYLLSHLKLVNVAPTHLQCSPSLPPAS